LKNILVKDITPEAKRKKKQMMKGTGRAPITVH
jgi:hypothetical protein